MLAAAVSFYHARGDIPVAQKSIRLIKSFLEFVYKAFLAAGIVGER